MDANQTSSKPQAYETRAKATLEQFLEAVKTWNPFHSGQISDPSDQDVDVPEIHQRDSDRLIHLAVQSLQTRKGIGVMLMGGAGVGKSHLLARLAGWAGQRGACYLFVHNLLGSSERMPRHLLRSILSLLVNSQKPTESNGSPALDHAKKKPSSWVPEYQQSTLYDLVHRVIKKTLKETKSQHNVSPQKCREALHRFARRDFQLPVPEMAEEILDVLFTFFQVVNQHPKLDVSSQTQLNTSIAWLSGDPISEEAANAISLTSALAEKDDEGLLRLPDDLYVESVLLVLTEMAAAVNRPFVICLDQVDNLNPDHVQSLTRFLHALVDHSHNLLIVTSGVKQTIDFFREQAIITEAAWDRLASRKLQLHRISPLAARQILLARLGGFFSHFGSIEELSALRREYELFPLSDRDFEQKFGEAIDVRPRDVISWAREKWEDEQFELSRLGPRWLEVWSTDPPGQDSGPLTPPLPPLEERINEAVEKRILEKISIHRENRGSLPPEPDNLAALVENLLACCANRQETYSFLSAKRIEGDKPAYHLEIREHHKDSDRDILNGVAIVATTDGRVSTGALRRLLNVAKTLDHRILVTDEDRMPLPMPPAGRKLYEELQELGKSAFLHIKLTFQDYATLDAMYGVIRQARVGDFEIDNQDGTTRAVSETEVVESLHRKDSFRQNPLLRELLEEPTAPTPKQPKPPRLKPDEVSQVIRGNLGWRISMTALEATTIVLQQPDGPKLTPDIAHKQIMKICEKLRDQGDILAKPFNETLMLTLP